MLRVQHITIDHPLYEQEIALRTAVLLAPIGYNIEDYKAMAPGREEQCEHFVATVPHPSGERVVGTATLFIDQDQPDSDFGKVQQVCVDKQLQGEGIGQKLMIAIEARSFGELGLSNLYCHAQLSAMPFYEKLGWIAEGDEFDEAGIRHRKMFISAPKPIESSESTH
ncbi:MAG: GNAT family N-acetyltransferase [Phycisphaerales bacterium]|nr:GNAT family N-acetyltransferase [Phycisphaerales bacterium]